MASGFSLLLLSLHRCRSLRSPLKPHKLHNASSTIALVWSLALTLAAVALTSLSVTIETAVCVSLPIILNLHHHHHQHHHHNYHPLSPAPFHLFTIILTFQIIVFTMVVIIEMIISTMVAKIPITSIFDKDLSRKMEGVKRYKLMTMTNVWVRLGTFFFCVLASSGSLPITRHILPELNLSIIIFAIPFTSVLDPWLFRYSLSSEDKKKTRLKTIMRQIELKLKYS